MALRQHLSGRQPLLLLLSRAFVWAKVEDSTFDSRLLRRFLRPHPEAMHSQDKASMPIWATISLHLFLFLLVCQGRLMVLISEPFSKLPLLLIQDHLILTMPPTTAIIFLLLLLLPQADTLATEALLSITLEVMGMLTTVDTCLSWNTGSTDRVRREKLLR